MCVDSVIEILFAWLPTDLKAAMFSINFKPSIQNFMKISKPGFSFRLQVTDIFLKFEPDRMKKVDNNYPNRIFLHQKWNSKLLNLNFLE